MSLDSPFEWPDVQAARVALAEVAAAPSPSVPPGAIASIVGDIAGRGPISAALGARARAVVPGGTQHTLAIRQPFPVQVARATPTTVIDLDGNEYFDLVQGGGANLLGDTSCVRSALATLLDHFPVGTALPHRYEIELAEAVVAAVDSVEMVRMAASGTEAAMAAIRIARAYTGHTHVLKIGSAYHGWSDQLLIGLRYPGSGLAAAGGVPRGLYESSDEVRPDDLFALEAALVARETRGGTAAVIVEPLGPQSGTWPSEESYPRELAQLCAKYGALLIFDEVVSGFRLGASGVQGRLGVRPDLTVFGKCIAGGQPGAGAVGGRAEVMAALNGPVGPGRQTAMMAGTLTGSPLSAAAGVVSLREAERTNAPARAAHAGNRLTAGLRDLMTSAGLRPAVYNFGSIIHLNLTGVTHLDPLAMDFPEQTRIRTEASTLFALACRAEGVLIPITGRLFTNAAMEDPVVDEMLTRMELALGRTGW